MERTGKHTAVSLAQNLPSLEFQNPFDSLSTTCDPGTFLPLHMEKRYGYPLVVWLNDLQLPELRLPEVMPQISLRNYIGITPPRVDGQLLASLSGSQQSANQRLSGKVLPAQQVGTLTDEIVSSECEVGINASLTTGLSRGVAYESVFESIDRARATYNINTRRIFIAGAGISGTLALEIALNHAEYFAGVISLGGALPASGPIFNNIRTNRQLPLFVAHSRDDKNCPESSFCNNLKSLHVGGFSVTARQYPGSDLVHRQMFHDMDNWIMELINGYDMTTSGDDQ